MSDALLPPVPPDREPDEVTFDALNLHADLLKGIHELGFVRPTPIQAQAIPPILAGRDVVGCAQTGTGKTAAFVLPILHRLMQRPGRGHVRALVIAPTRELALQSMEHLRELSRHVTLRGLAVFGGVPMEHQTTQLRQGIDIISATPGRLLDHVYSGHIDFVDLETFVLDEADRMLDMGFLPDIKHIIRLLPPQRQTLLFSATMPDEILALVREFLRDPAIVQVGRRTAAAGVRHVIYPVPRAQKVDLLPILLRADGMDSVLIFTRTKIAADRLAHKLLGHNFRVGVIHGDLNQGQRLRALERFRDGRNQILVATDIAARGLDISDVSHVINYDVPGTVEDYIHRVGRTARADATGDAITLVDPEDEPMIRDIEATLGHPLERIVQPGFEPAAAPHGHHRASPGPGRGGRGRRRRGGAPGQHAHHPQHPQRSHGKGTQR